MKTDVIQDNDFFFFFTQNVNWHNDNYKTLRSSVCIFMFEIYTYEKTN